MGALKIAATAHKPARRTAPRKPFRLASDIPTSTLLTELTPAPLRDARQRTLDGAARILRQGWVLHQWHQGLGQLLAQLHAPLIETVDAPDHALGEHLMLVERDQLA